MTISSDQRNAEKAAVESLLNTIKYQLDNSRFDPGKNGMEVGSKRVGEIEIIRYPLGIAWNAGEHPAMCLSLPISFWRHGVMGQAMYETIVCNVRYTGESDIYEYCIYNAGITNDPVQYPYHSLVTAAVKSIANLIFIRSQI